MTINIVEQDLKTVLASDGRSNKNTQEQFNFLICELKQYGIKGFSRRYLLSMFRQIELTQSVRQRIGRMLRGYNMTYDLKPKAVLEEQGRAGLQLEPLYHI